MRKNSMIRADKELIDAIKSCKITKRESHAEVIKRLIEKDRRFK